jgi:Tfp pilus assembly protein PilX
MRMTLSRIRRRLAAESGYSIVAVMLLLLVGSLFGVAAWTSANSDIPQTQKDYNRKQAMDAAESGINWYLYNLNQDNQYWSYCNQPAGYTATTPLIQPWDGTSTRPFRKLPGSKASYVDELVPQNGATSCAQGDDTSMIDKSSGILQIKSTGQSQAVKRTVTATFRRKGFLDFLYFTKYETTDPIAFQVSNPNYIGLKTPGACDVYRWATPTRPAACATIQFQNQDVVNGPFHTNDNALVCGSPTFGRTAADKVETGGQPAFIANGGCANTPQVKGTLNDKADLLEVPSSNGTLANIADPQYTFTGRKFIKLNGNSITVSDDYAGTVNVKTLPWPANGVIYVKTGATNNSNCGYDIQNTYNNGTGCADVFVNGTYSQGLTIGADNDIIVNGNTLRQGNGMLGLIANNFVRLWHPVNRSSCGSNAGSSSMGPGPLTNPEVDAAILSLNHSFIVDNYDCGAPNGTLKVVGAIAQKYRGPVGTGSGTTIVTGYIKNYNYDDRFKTQNPPYFLNPVDSKWQMIRFTEQIPAR